MDWTEFKMRPAEERSYVEKYAGPFPESEPPQAKNAWMRKATDLLDRLGARKRVNAETGKLIYPDVYSEEPPPPVLAEPKKSVSEILKTKRA